MNDKQLLELAAKAIGLKYHAFVNDQFIGYGLNIGDLETPIWNPLTFDGDALRLSAKLAINVGYVGTDDDDTIIGAVAGDHEFEVIDEHNICAAVRRVIVVKAAEIGKTK